MVIRSPINNAPVGNCVFEHSKSSCSGIGMGSHLGVSEWGAQVGRMCTAVAVLCTEQCLAMVTCCGVVPQSWRALRGLEAHAWTIGCC